MSKHRKSIRPPRDDLETNPGIGTSKGSKMAGADAPEIEGVSTEEGDILNDTTPQGGVNPRQRGRTNR
jgi:hypothetical protein